MSFANKELLDKVMDLVLKAAADRKLDAGYSGRWDDGGGGRLEDQVKFFKLGMTGSFPPEWEIFKKQLDPEYIEYMRLKRKFG